MKQIINWIVSRQLKPMLVNWKTSLVGIAMAIPFFVTCLNDIGGAIQKLQDIAAGNTTDIDGVIELVKAAAAAAGAGFILARDGNKTSEQSNAG